MKADHSVQPLVQGVEVAAGAGGNAGRRAEARVGDDREAVDHVEIPVKQRHVLGEVGVGHADEPLRTGRDTGHRAVYRRQADHLAAVPLALDDHVAATDVDLVVLSQVEHHAGSLRDKFGLGRLGGKAHRGRAGELCTYGQQGDHLRHGLLSFIPGTRRSHAPGRTMPLGTKYNTPRAAAGAVSLSPPVPYLGMCTLRKCRNPLLRRLHALPGAAPQLPDVSGHDGSVSGTMDQ